MLYVHNYWQSTIKILIIEHFSLGFYFFVLWTECRNFESVPYAELSLVRVRYLVPQRIPSIWRLSHAKYRFCRISEWVSPSNLVVFYRPTYMYLVFCDIKN